MALLMAAANVFGLMALATADDNHEIIAWMTDCLLPSNSQYASRMDGLTRPTRKARPTEGSNNTRADFLNMSIKGGGCISFKSYIQCSTKINKSKKISYSYEHPRHTG